MEFKVNATDDLPYIYDINKFSNRVRSARAHCDLTQAGLAKKAGLQVNTVKRIEAQSVDPGILTCLSVARVLDLPLPETNINERVSAFAVELFSAPESAAAKFDQLFAKLCHPYNSRLPNQKGNGDEELYTMPPRNLLWLTQLDRTGFVFSITHRGGFKSSDIESKYYINRSDIYPIDLAFILDDIRSYFKELGDSSDERTLITKLSPLWKHLLSGRSDNPGLSRLFSEISKVESSLAMVENKNLKNINIKAMAVLAFNNQLELKRMMHEAAKSSGIVFSEAYMTYLVSYLRLLNTLRKREKDEYWRIILQDVEKTRILLADKLKTLDDLGSSKA